MLQRYWGPVALAICLMATAATAQAQYSAIPNITGPNAGQQFRTDINERFGGQIPTTPLLVSRAFANLPPEQDGLLFLCNDCQRTTPCAGGGAGALARGERGAWSCADGSVNGLLYVQAFGAKGNGTTDDSAAINAATAVANAGKEIYLPAGTYDIKSASISIGGSNMVLQGAGRDLTTIKLDPAATITDLIQASNQSGVTIRDLTIDCNRANNATAGVTGAELTRTSDSYLENVTIQNCSGNGAWFSEPLNRNGVIGSRIVNTGIAGANTYRPIYASRINVGTTSGLFFRNNWIDTTSAASSGAEGIKVAAGNAAGIVISDVWETDNYVTVGAGAATTGIEDFNSSPSSFTHVNVTGNHIFCPGTAATGWGISLGGANGTYGVVANNYVDSCSGWGIEDTFMKTSVTGNLIVNSGMNTLDASGTTINGGIWTGSSFTGNTIIGQPHGVTDAIQAGNGTISDILIAHNNILYPSLYGIRTNGPISA
ncbi:MAG: glycosyl hydrolase family 28-related protein, partial [Candidatus Binataceae bacterium]